MLIVYLFYYATGLYCELYVCSSLPKGQCIANNGSVYYVDQCPSTSYCDVELDKNFSYCVPSSSVPPPAWPGESCAESGCLYGYCNETICVGKKYQEACTLNDDCDPGLYCKRGVCSKLISDNLGPCTSDYECKSSSGCNYGKCAQYFSYQEGQEVECTNNRSLICSSGSCYNGYCIGLLANDKGAGSLCDTNSDCTSSKYYMPIYPFYFYSECQCGMDGKSYCSQFNGDPSMVNYLSTLLKWVRSGSIKNCNTVRRFSYGCMESVWSSNSFALLKYYELLAFNYTQIATSQDCVLSVYFPYYLEYQSMVSWGSRLLISLILLSFY
jgi:hypothetical protein